MVSWPALTPLCRQEMRSCRLELCVSLTAVLPEVLPKGAFELTRSVTQVLRRADPLALDVLESRAMAGVNLMMARPRKLF